MTKTWICKWKECSLGSELSDKKLKLISDGGNEHEQRIDID